MSLKAFHIGFIVLAIILGLGFGFWGIRDYSVSKNLLNRYLGVGSFVSSFLLAVYLSWFVYKLKKNNL